MSIVDLKKRKLYTVFFEDSKKSHLFAKLIQLCQKYSTTGVEGYNPNHIGCAFIDFNQQNTLLEAIFVSGNTLTKLDDKIKNYKGTIEIYDTSIKFSEIVLNSVIKEEINKKYGILSALAALEFTYQKGVKYFLLNCIFLFINTLLDFIKVFIPFYKGSFCVKLWLKVVISCDHNKGELSKILQTKYENTFKEIDIDELTPIDALLSTHQAKNKLIYIIKDGEIIFDANVRIQ